MRESLGNALLLNLVIIFAGIVMLFFVGILSYSKAYRVKNKIIDTIEKYDGYDGAQKDIDEFLRDAGYSVVSKDYCNDPNGRVQRHVKEDIGVTSSQMKSLNNSVSGYNYCVFEITGKTTSVTGEDSPKYYVVVTFVHFNFPIIGDMINIPVYGETKILGRTYNY